MHLLNYISPWFVAAQLASSLALPPSINSRLYKRELSGANFENKIPEAQEPDGFDPFWQQEVEESLQAVRLLAENARQVPRGHEIGREWFGGDDFYDLRTRMLPCLSIPV